MIILIYVIDVKKCQQRSFKKMVIIVWTAGKNEHTLIVKLTNWLYKVQALAYFSKYSWYISTDFLDFL